MKTFKFFVVTNEEWEYHYEIKAGDLEEAKARLEQETVKPTKSHRRDVSIVRMDEK